MAWIWLYEEERRKRLREEDPDIEFFDEIDLDDDFTYWILVIFFGLVILGGSVWLLAQFVF